MTKRNVLILLDYSSLLSTSFYGNLPNSYKFAKTDEEKEKALPYLLQTSNGEYTNGVVTMMSKIENIIKKINPKYLAGGWDLTRETFRRRLYPSYKAHRKDTRHELSSQFSICQEILNEMNIPSFAFTDYEADDIIGTLSKKFCDEISVIIITKDQDALQLINEGVSVWLLTSKADELYLSRGLNRKDFQIIDGVFEYNIITFEEDYFISPIQMVDKKALEGDKSDNIPGVKGVGEKAVIPLLREFHTLENIYDYIENTPKNEVNAFFKELGIMRSPLNNLLKEPTCEGELCGKNSALLSKKLATIYCDIPELDIIKLSDLELNINLEGRERMYTKYELKSLLRR